MRYLKETLRLHFECKLTDREIARCCGISPTTVGDIVRRVSELELNWPLPEIGDGELKTLFWGDRSDKPLPDLDYLCLELKRKSVTRRLLWDEYKKCTPDGYGYTTFCDLIKKHKARQEPVMRQDYRFGEQLMVDWAGQTMTYLDSAGVTKKAYLFVGILPASNYTYVNVYDSMAQVNWLQAHMDTLDYFGGVPQLLIPDNAKTAVSKACMYDPEQNPDYQQFAEYYQLAVLPTRVAAPRDKAKVETAVQIAERWILAALRNVSFLNFNDLRRTVLEKLEELNDKPFSKMDGCRRSLFEAEEKNCLKPLPQERFSLGIWKKARVANDYHVQVQSHYYSVPYRYVGDMVDVRVSQHTLEIFHDNRRIASHQVNHEHGKATTDAAHRPPQHSAMINFSVSDYLDRARKLGPNIETAVLRAIEKYPRPEMSFRGVNGIFRLVKDYGKDRVDKACLLATENDLAGYQQLKNILQNNRDKLIQTPDPKPIKHSNIRGHKNYEKGTDKC